MIETVCAFAHTGGGLLVIGIGDVKDLKPSAEPDSRLFGVEENPESFDLFLWKRKKAPAGAFLIIK